MSTIEIKQINLIGLALKKSTINLNGQSSIDCGNLWEAFEKGKYADTIAGKLSEEIFGVYHHYEGDSSKPFSYFVGCKVEPESEIPPGLESLIIPAGLYQKIIAKGKMPDCVISAWKDVWKSGIPRSYQIDFEVYDDRCKDWNNAEVEVYLSLKP